MKYGRAAKLLVLAALIWTGIGASAGDWEQIASFYRPLRGTKVREWGRQWGIKGPDGKLLTPWVDCAWMENCCTTYEAYFLYRGSEPVTIGDVLLDGKPIAGCYRTAGNVVWHRVMPETVRRGEVVSLLVKFWYTPEKPVKITFVTGGKKGFSHTADFRRLSSSDLIRRITLSRDRKLLRLWVEGDGEITRILFDGTDCGTRAKIGTFYGGTIPVTITFDEPLAKGSCHNVFVGRKKGGSAVTFRAFPHIFHTGIYNGPAGEGLKQHHFDACWSLHPIPPETVKRFAAEGIFSISSVPVKKIGQYRGLPGMAVNYLPDEPDASEAMKFSNIRWMGQRLGMLAPEINGIAKTMSREAGELPNAVILDKTNRPANFFAYGRIADFTAIDYYCISSDLQPLTCYPSARVSRIAAEPLPSWIALGCFSRPTTSKWKRFPTAQEMHLMALSSLAGGAQSVAYWMYVDGSKTKGPQSNPGLWHDMGRLNGEMKMIAHLLESSYPADPSVVEAPQQVIASVLRTAGDEATVVILLNKNCRSDARGMHIPELPDFPVSLRLPDGARAAGLGRLSADGLSDCRIDGVEAGKVRFTVSALGDSAVYVIFHSAAAAEKVREIFDKVVRPGNLVADRILLGKQKAPDADFASLTAALPDAGTILPVRAGGAAAVDATESRLDVLQGQSFLRGDGGVSLTWELPETPGEIFFQYSSSAMAELTSKGRSGSETMLLSPSVRRICRMEHDGTPGELTLRLPGGTVGEKLFFVRKADRKTAEFRRAALTCAVDGDDPFSKEKAEALSDGNLLKGPRWSNSKDRLRTKEILLTAVPRESASFRHLIVCGHYNSMYALREIGGIVHFTDGTSLVLPSRPGFTGVGKGYRKYVFFWELPDKPVAKIVLRPMPQHHLWLFIGEIIAIERG